jgi:hypothetical protein
MPWLRLTLTVSLDHAPTPVEFDVVYHERSYSSSRPDGLEIIGWVASHIFPPGKHGQQLRDTVEEQLYEKIVALRYV